MIKRIRMNISLTKEENALIKKIAKEEEKTNSGNKRTKTDKVNI